MSREIFVVARDRPDLYRYLSETFAEADNVDVILERALFQPYATEPISITDPDAGSSLNPWSRLGLDGFGRHLLRSAQRH